MTPSMFSLFLAISKFPRKKPPKIHHPATFRYFSPTMTATEEKNPAENSQNEKFGEIYTQFRGKAKEAVEFLLKKRGGIAIGVFQHPDIGEIDLPWGEYNAKTKQGKGLVKILTKHPEIKIDDLGEVIAKTKIVSKTPKKVRMTGNGYMVVLGKDPGNNHWLLTAFEKRTGQDL